MNPLATMACLLAATALAALPAARAEGVALPSCVSPERLKFSPGDDSALLDAPDRDAVAAAMVNRYPVLQRDGFAASHIILWQRAGKPLLYVALALDEADPGSLCFTATFAATGFEITPVLARKYFSQAGDRI